MIYREASTCVFLSDTSSRFADPLPPENPNDFFLVPLGRSRLSVTPSKLHNSITPIQGHNVTPPSFNVTKTYSVPARGVGNETRAHYFSFKDVVQNVRVAAKSR